MRKIEFKLKLIFLGLLLVFIAGIIIYFLISYPNEYLNPSKKSIRIFDRNGNLLIELVHNGYFCEEISLREVPEKFIKLLLLSEDRDFFKHHGVSLRALGRAIVQNIKNLKVVSGGSTITMQLAKLKAGNSKNNLITKLFETFEAIKLEMHFSKEEILQGYLNEVYLGNNIFGIKKASKVYFNKLPKELDLLEMAFLVKIINSPSLVYEKQVWITQKARKLIYLALKEGIVSEEEYSTSNSYGITLKLPKITVYAPHFCFYAFDEAKKLAKDITEIHTTLDLNIYTECLNISRNVLENLSKFNANQASLVIIENSNMEIISMVGSIDYFGESGMINGVLVKRQPGSTMKSFTYALGFEKKLITPSSILEDIYSSFSARYGKYIPKNYDERYHGPVKAGYALGNSYNVATINLLHKIGLTEYYNFLKNIGFKLDRSPRFYGLGLTLGNADIDLLTLTRAYTIFPNQGILKELRCIKYIKTQKGEIIIPNSKVEKKVISEETAFLINHILSNHKYKVSAFGVDSPFRFSFPVAVKTGTSKDYRDNTIIGYTPQYTIGIWVGNFESGESMIKLPASRGAGLILKDILLFMYNNNILKSQEFPKPKNITNTRICSLSGKIASTYCQQTEDEYFPINNIPSEKCDWCYDGIIKIPPQFYDWAKERFDNVKIINEGVKILFPKEGDVFKLDKSVRKNIQKIILKASPQDSEEIEWYINNQFYRKGNYIEWQLEKGNYVIKAFYKNLSDEVFIKVVD